jgi:hypothetical protein
MKNTTGLGILSSVMLGMSFILLSPIASAAEKQVTKGKRAVEEKPAVEERVIEDTFVINDPTVAKDAKLLYGVSVDYFSTTVKTDSPTLPFTRNFIEPGISGFVARGDFTALLSYRAGSSSINSTGTGAAAGLTIAGDSKQTVLEGSVRWLARDYTTKFITPYLGFGYFQNTADYTFTVNPGGSVVTAHKTAQALVPAVGGIIPVNAKIGFRAEMRRYFGSVKSSVNDGTSTINSSSDNAAENRDYLTMYYNIDKSLNAQLGYQFWPDSNATGYYMMLGYTFR